MFGVPSKWILVGGIALTVGVAVKLAMQSTDKTSNNNNVALLFIKPHGQVDGMQTFVEGHLARSGLRVVQKGQLPGKAIEDMGAIDAHYAAIGKYATGNPADLPLTGEKKKEFEVKFGESFEAAAKAGRILNVPEAQKEFNFDGAQLDQVFNGARAEFGMKLAPGCYVSYLRDKKRYVVNGFYGRMREEYINKKAVVSWMVVQWPESTLNWQDFRAKVLGATDPTKAEVGSIRQRILVGAEKLGLGFTPTTGNNCVHGSASPLEGYNERRIWTQVKPESDAFGAAMLAAGLTANQIEWCVGNPTVDGSPLFDVVEDTNTSECIRRLTEMVAKHYAA